MFSDFLILIVLILLNAFFASSEIALISLNDNKIKQMAKEGHKKAGLLVQLLSEPSKFLATIQIGITLAGFLASAFASETFAEKLVLLLTPLNLPLSVSLLKKICVVIITIILSYFTLVFGELVPKRIAMKKAEPIAMFVVRPLTLLLALTLPFVRFLTFSTNICVRILGMNPHEKDEEITEEEIRLLVDVGEETGAIHEDEKHMINNIFEFNNKTVVEIMTHRTDIIAVSKEASFEEVIACIKEERFSRIPVYDNNIDNIVGIFYSKDLLQFLDTNYDKSSFDLKSMIREPYFVPFSKKTDELFREMKEKNIHIAIILDEYGGTAGLVSLEDLIEEIVGNIFDEDDEVEKEIEVINETTFIALGSVNLDDLRKVINVNFDDPFHDTLGGFLIGKLGKIPNDHEKISLEFENHVFKVLDVEDKKISKVRISKIIS